MIKQAEQQKGFLSLMKVGEWEGTQDRNHMTTLKSFWPQVKPLLILLMYFYPSVFSVHLLSTECMIFYYPIQN